jgi:hypothetical protein
MSEPMRQTLIWPHGAPAGLTNNSGTPQQQPATELGAQQGNVLGQLFNGSAAAPAAASTPLIAGQIFQPAQQSANPWGDMANHPDFQAFLQQYGFNAPGEANGGFTQGGAQPNWLGSIMQQQPQQPQGAIAGPNAENPVAGANYLGGSW